MRLVREWSGTINIVTVGEDKIIRWNERDWKSLSEVARAITGTRWSGPAFFGLKQKRQAARQRSAAPSSVPLIGGACAKAFAHH